jgi:hypothetical protein
MKIRPFTTILLSSFACGVVALETPVGGNFEQSTPGNSRAESDWLTSVAKALRAEFSIPAVWLAVSIDGKSEIVCEGLRKLGEPAQAQPSDRVMIGSISKVLNGVWREAVTCQPKAESIAQSATHYLDGV